MGLIATTDCGDYGTRFWLNCRPRSKIIEEVSNWCSENAINYNLFWDSIEFYNDDDAMAFKLRWG